MSGEKAAQEMGVSGLWLRTDARRVRRLRGRRFGRMV